MKIPWTRSLWCLATVVACGATLWVVTSVQGCYPFMTSPAFGQCTTEVDAGKIRGEALVNLNILNDMEPFLLEHQYQLGEYAGDVELLCSLIRRYLLDTITSVNIYKDTGRVEELGNMRVNGTMAYHATDILERILRKCNIVYKRPEKDS